MRWTTLSWGRRNVSAAGCHQVGGGAGRFGLMPSAGPVARTSSESVIPRVSVTVAVTGAPRTPTRSSISWR